MSDATIRVDSKAVSQNLLSAAKSAPLAAVKTAAPAPAPKAAAASTPASVVALAQPAASLGLYTAKGTSTGTGGTSNSDGSYTAGKDAVSITIENSESGYDNKIYYSTDNFVTKHLVGIDNQTGTVNIGSFAPGTRIDFGIDNGQGDFFRTGAASANSDNFKHTQASAVANGGHQVGFEDLRNGGDRDFNDAIITVRSTPTALSTPAAKAPETRDNRSGLGDGTNPGQGAGKANSPNTGTQNPSTTKTPVPATPVANKPIAATVPAPAPAKTAAPAPAPAKDNRSGLGDSTNPGQGAGKANSPNTGTQNPSTTKTPAAAAPVATAAPAPAKSTPQTTAAAPVASKTPAPAAPVAAKPVTTPAPAPTAAKTTPPASIVPPVASKAPAAATTTAPAKDNRSGLADGTNPGQGAGKANSPNTGTQNPSASTVIDKKTEAALASYLPAPAAKNAVNVHA